MSAAKRQTTVNDISSAWILPNGAGTGEWTGKKPSVLIFDINETCIDFESMTPIFERVYGDGKVMREWLSQLIMYSMTMSSSGIYVDYFTLGKGLMKMVGEIHGKDISDAEAAEIEKGMRNMKAHSDVKEGLQMLKNAGFRLVSLTNSPHLPNAKTPLDQAGLTDLFEREFSIQDTRTYKPASINYHYVAAEMGVAPVDCCMVATHVWDTVGAQGAGLASCLVTRPGNAPLPVKGLPQPNIVTADMIEMAKKMIDIWKPAKASSGSVRGH